MAMLPKHNPEHIKGQADHIDAWLMSYADMITLLFMFFIIFVSFSKFESSQTTSVARGDPEHPYIEEHNDVLALDSPYEALYRSMTGIVVANAADQAIAVTKTSRGMSVDMASSLFFDAGSADLRAELPALSAIALLLKDAPDTAGIEVAAYTDDVTPENSKFATGWELSAMQAAHIVSFLIDAGVDPARLHAANYSSTHPVVPNKDIAGDPIIQNRLRNQRVVITVEKLFDREMVLQ